MAIYMWKDDTLCFTANTANSTMQLTVYSGTPTSVSLETSSDLTTWIDYTVGDIITLTNVGDKVYWRNKSETDAYFNTGDGRYQFVMTGSISASGNINYLLNKNSTTTLSDNCFSFLFYNCTSLTTPPELPATTVPYYAYYALFSGCTNLTVAPILPATTVGTYSYGFLFANTSITVAPKLPATTLAAACYGGMFQNCTSLTTIPKLPATTLPSTCYMRMFEGCTNVKISSTQTGEYQTEYRIPTSGTGTTDTNWNFNMFASTGGTFTSNPSVNTTYYTSNTVV